MCLDAPAKRSPDIFLQRRLHAGNRRFTEFKCHLYFANRNSCHVYGRNLGTYICKSGRQQCRCKYSDKPAFGRLDAVSINADTHPDADADTDTNANADSSADADADT